MCGIVGYLNLNGSSVDSGQNWLAPMCQTIHHRGPDDQGMITIGPAALGMTRLSIIDVASGQQPIANEDESVWIVFNGEIYNFHELQKIVTGRGHTLKTKSDTETIVHLYEEFGIDCLNYLEGMFAFAIWDKNKNRLFIARDRMGEKPLHWGVFDGTLIFASELKSILAHPKSRKEINVKALQKYLALEYVPAPLSMFEGIHKLMPAHYMIVENGEVTTQRYWVGKPEAAKLTEQEAQAKLVELLDSSTVGRLISDVPLGVFLSGGIDSSSIAALATRHLSTPLKTFSIGFADSSFDESSHAELVAKHLGTDHHQAIFSPKEALSTMEDLWQVLDEPMADASILPTYFLSRMTRNSVTVALSGEGGDELFGGYPTYQAHKLAAQWQMIPSPLRKGILEPVIKSLPVSQNNLSLDFKAKRFISSVYEKPEIRHYRWMGSFSIHNQLSLLKPGYSPFSTQDDLYRDLLDNPLINGNGNGKSDVVNKIMLVDQITYLPDDLLVKSDRASMAASLEVRLPFLAYPLVEFARSLPVSFKLNKMTTKYLLKKAMAPYLPESILKRPKKGFGIPTAKWLNKEFATVVDEFFNEGFIKKQGIFQYQSVKQLLTEHRSLAHDRRKELWTLLMFQWWWNKYFGN